MIDLGLTTDINRLYTAIDHSRDAARPFKKNRKRMLQQFVGSNYNDNGAKQEVLVNLLSMTADAYTIGLAAENPRIRISSQNRDLWPFAYRYQQVINNLIKEIRFAETHQAIILDAFFSCGVAKVYQADWEPVQLEDDVWADPGRPYIGRISPDDFGMDLSVKDFRRCKFMWDEYRVSWESVRNEPDFDQDVIKELSPSSKWDRDDEQVSQITSGTMVDGDDYEPMIDLMDVWLPEISKVGIFSRHVPTKPLKLLDVGPEGGPYEVLTFADVPDNVMPSSPAQNLLGLHELYNGLLRKQSRQAKRQKTNPIYRPAGVDDASRLKTHGDGEWVQVNDTSNVDVIKQGGVDPANMAFGLNVYDLFDRAAGNLTAMAGLGAQAETATQEELIHQASSRKEAKMQNRDHAFVSRLMGKLGHLVWADEVLEFSNNSELAPGTGVYVDTSWTPEMREGDFWQYNFEIEDNSMNYDPPAAKIEKMERMVGTLERFYPMISESGGTLDVQEIIRQYGDLLNFPEAENFVTFATPPSVDRPGPASAEGPSMPRETTRNYVRRSVSTGGTPQSRSHILQQTLLNGSETPAQTDSLARVG